MPKLAADASGPFALRERGRELFLSRLLQTCFALQSSLDRHFLRFGVTFQEAAVLVRCVKSGGVTPGQLAIALTRDKGKITRFVDRLEARGLVVRNQNPADHRVVLVKATREGARVALHLVELLKRLWSELFAGISDSDLRSAEKALPRLLENAMRVGGKGHRVERRGEPEAPTGKAVWKAECPADGVGLELGKTAPAGSRRSASRRRAQRLSRAQIENLFPGRN